MTGTTELRAAITGLIGLAATEEEMLLATAPDGKDGSADRWAAARSSRTTPSSGSSR
jgi:hypothetical protein